MRRYSSLTAPRRWKSAAPSASNSSCSQPTPTPTVTRPRESTSMVASAFAVVTGFRYGRIITLVHRRSRVVFPAKHAAHRVRVLRLDHLGKHDVVGDHHRREPQRLAALHQALESLRRRRLTTRRQVEPVSHRHLLRGT